jgi:hypothetical protein
MWNGMLKIWDKYGWVVPISTNHLVEIKRKLDPIHAILFYFNLFFKIGLHHFNYVYSTFAHSYEK